MYQPGDLVIYRMQKQSASPGPRAVEIQPAPRGETYTYVVDKFWIVSEVQESGNLVLQTRRGKRHIVDCDDPQLRPVRWLGRLLYRKRFPSLA